MFIVSVIPIVRHAPKEILSYRSREKFSPGVLIFVPFRKKHIPAMVTAVHDLREDKTALKRASFQVRTITNTTTHTLPLGITKSIEETATYHGKRAGMIYHALMKEAFLSFISTHDTQKRKRGVYKKKTLEKPRDERLLAYRTYIAHAKKHGNVVLLSAPTLVECSFLHAFFTEQGDTTHLITGKTTKRHIEKILKTLSTEGGALIITPAFLAVPLTNVETLIIDSEGREAWRDMHRDFLDFRVFGNFRAKNEGLTLIIGDFPLRSAVRPPQEKNPSDASLGSISVVSMKKDVLVQEERNTPFRILGHTLITAIEKTGKERVPIILIASRRGYAPLSICRDCGSVVSDKSGRPLLLQTNEKGEKVFISRDKKYIKGTEDPCGSCGSWNILPLGIGVERVRDQVAELFPKRTLSCFTHFHEEKTSDALRKALQEGDCIVGTEGLLTLLPARIPTIGIVSADSLLSLPFYGARERFLRLVLMARERSQHVILQTRNDDVHARGGDLKKFFKEEIALRTTLRYPPTWTLVRIEASGNPALLKKHISFLTAHFAKWRPEIIPETREGVTIKSGVLLRIKKKNWPEADIVSLLTHLPIEYRSIIDPESIL